ncbi:toll-like receptor Tollo [Copidosoma floridanum]|uniref:toll-like receptor Tollo n=1 Tax=Copidosoma floridanum TaxID=29053 RepID=UPI0006C9469D|nr:toll-like receptor Tollo [Copidosoma floridanum]
MLSLTLFFGFIISAFASYIPPGPKFTCSKIKAVIHPCVCVHGSDQGVYIKCDNTNLASLSLAFVSLGNEKVLIEELTIYKCNIVRFYGPALYQLNVRVLKFIQTPLKLIEEHSFLGVNRTLQELYLIQSSLEKFPKEAFSILGNLTTLSIRGHRIEELPSDIFADSLAALKVERFDFSNGKLNLLPIETFGPLKKLKILDLHGNQIQDLQRNQFKGLRDVETLDLSYNLIDKLDASYFYDLTKLGSCNISNNRITELKRGTFARNSLIKVLNLNNNKIQKLDSNTFRGMRLLRRLYLSNNRISEVSRGTFGTMTRIGVIDVSKNMIKKVDYQMFYQLQYAEHIDVSENQVTIVEKEAFKGLFSAVVNLSHNVITKIESSAFENCANIVILDLSHNRIEDISQTAFDSASYATTLQLSFNFLTSLNQIPLYNMTGLKVLNVSYNVIRSIPRQTFPKLYELHTIDLSHNNFSDIYNAIFQTLFNLRHLNLSHNFIEKINPSTFGHLPTLLDLNLSYNKLNDVSKGSFTRLASCRTLSVKHNELKKIFLIPISLDYLDFSENLLEEIPSIDVWPSMNALRSLDLSKNRLGNNLVYGSFENLRTLRTLNLQANNISNPPAEALGMLSSLQYVYLQDNNLTSLNKAAFGKLPIVFELNLAHNQIHVISERAFEGLLQLLTLKLTSNQIKHIPNGAFRGLVSLQNLDLSYNKLQKLDNKTHGLLDDCLSLEKINLSHNKIVHVTSKTFPHNPWVPYRIREIDLSQNGIQALSFDFTLGTRKSTYLNLSDNNINEIRKYVIGNLTEVVTLDLSHNELTDLSEQDFISLPPNLTNLVISHNRFNHLPWKKIVAMPNLRLLDLEYNNFRNFDDILIKVLNNGTILKYAGNPLHCDCYVRPLRRWLDTFTEIPMHWASVKCANPNYVADLLLQDVSELLMSCPNKDIMKNPKYDISPDVKYRDIEYDSDDEVWTVSWYVTNRGDTGDFYLIVREPGSSKNILEKNIVYKERSFKIRPLPDPNLKYEICVLARDSMGNVKTFQSSQCKILDKQTFSEATTQSTVNILLVFLTPVIFFVSL